MTNAIESGAKLTRETRLSDMRRPLSALATVLIVALVSTATAQTSYQWIGGDGNWSNASMWSPNGVPGVMDSAWVDVSGSYAVTADADITVGWLKVGDDSTGAIFVELGTFGLTVGGSAVVAAGGQLTTEAGATVTADSLIVGGTVELRAVTAVADISVLPAARLTFFETSTLQGSITNAGSSWVQGSWFAGRSADLTVDGPIVNNGTIVLWGDHSGSVLGNATLTSTGTLVNTGRLQARGSLAIVVHELEAVLDNRGEVWLRESSLTINAPDATHTLGMVTVEDGPTLRVEQSGISPSVLIAGPVSIDGEGELIVSGGRADLADPSILATGGSVTFTDGVELHLADDFTVTGNLTLEDLSLNGPGRLSVGAGGTLDLIDATLNTDLSVLADGRLNVRRLFLTTAGLANQGDTWMLGSWFAGGQVRATLAENFTNDGRLVLWGDHSGSVIGDVELTVPDSVINNGRIVTSGTDIRAAQQINGILENRGPLILQARDLDLSAASGEHVNADTIRIDDTHTLRLEGGAGLRHEQGSLVSGEGTLDVRTAPGGLTATSGAIGPGRPPGQPGLLTVAGSLLMNPDSFFDVDLAGTAAGVEHDQLHVTSTLTLDGTLRIAFPDTFDTAVGDTFNIATAGTINGMFASVEQETQMGKHFSITYDGNVVRLITLSGGVAIQETGPALPREFALRGSYPNPFNPVATIGFDLPGGAEVTLDVFDVLGRRVRSLGPTMHEAGAGRTIVFEAGALPSGVYLYRLTARDLDAVSVANGSFTLVK